MSARMCVYFTCGARCRQGCWETPSFVWSLGRQVTTYVVIPGCCLPPPFPWGQDLGWPGREVGLEEVRAGLPQAGPLFLATVL